MKTDQFAGDVLKKLLERSDAEAALNPHDTLMKIADEEQKKHWWHWFIFRTLFVRKPRKIGKFERIIQMLERHR